MYGFTPVPNIRSYALATLVAEFSAVDLVEMEIQGAELSVVTACPVELSAKFKRVHIGTHSRELERGLRAFSSDLGWSCIWDFCNEGVRKTPYGSLSFADGVQMWENVMLMSRM